MAEGDVSSVEMFNAILDENGSGILEFWIMLLTVALVCTKYILLPSQPLDESTNPSMMRKKNIFITVAYILAIILFVTYINFNNYKSVCSVGKGDDLSSDAMYFIVMISVFPWLSILGICFAILNVLPGWKAPFSNTFGYFITMFLLGGQHMVNEILNISETKDENKAIQLVLENNFGNLINDYTPANIEEFRKLGSDVGAAKLKTKPYSSAVETYNNIAKLILLKDYIAEGIWFVLMGLFVVNLTNNYVGTQACL